MKKSVQFTKNNIDEIRRISMITCALEVKKLL